MLSCVFVHRVFSAYFVRFEGAGVIRRFPQPPPVLTGERLIIKPALASKVVVTRMAF